MPSEELGAAEEANQSDEERYAKAYREARRTLDEAIDLIAQFKHFATDPDERSDLGEELIELKRERADLVRAFLAFHQGRAVMVPPSKSLVDQIIANTKEVVELTVERTTAEAVLKLATKALQKFAEIQDIG